VAPLPWLKLRRDSDDTPDYETVPTPNSAPWQEDRCRRRTRPTIGDP